MEEMEIDKINSQDILNSIDLNKINQIEKKKRGRPKKTQQMLTSIPKLKIQSGEEEDLEEEYPFKCIGFPRGLMHPEGCCRVIRVSR